MTKSKHPYFLVEVKATLSLRDTTEGIPNDGTVTAKDLILQWVEILSAFSFGSSKSEKCPVAAKLSMQAVSEYKKKLRLASQQAKDREGRPTTMGEEKEEMPAQGSTSPEEPEVEDEEEQEESEEEDDGEEEEEESESDGDWEESPMEPLPPLFVPRVLLRRRMSQHSSNPLRVADFEAFEE